MRPRITNKVDISQVIDSIEHRVKVYNECVKDIMASDKVNRDVARAIIKQRVINRIIFKQ